MPISDPKYSSISSGLRIDMAYDGRTEVPKCKDPRKGGSTRIGAQAALGVVGRHGRPSSKSTYMFL